MQKYTGKISSGTSIDMRNWTKNVVVVPASSGQPGSKSLQSPTSGSFISGRSLSFKLISTKISPIFESIQSNKILREIYSFKTDIEAIQGIFHHK